MMMIKKKKGSGWKWDEREEKGGGGETNPARAFMCTGGVYRPMILYTESELKACYVCVPLSIGAHMTVSSNALDVILSSSLARVFFILFFFLLLSVLSIEKIL